MKQKAITFIILLMSVSAVWSQNDIYLKNGSVIKGEIIEYMIGGQIKIQTKDGSVWAFEADEVEKIEKASGENLAKKNSCLAGALSFIVPGVGQFYNGNIALGFAYLGGHIAFTTISITEFSQHSNKYGLTALGIAAAIDVMSIIQAVNEAKKINRKRGYTLGNNVYFNISPTILQTSQFSSDVSFGVSLGLTF